MRRNLRETRAVYRKAGAGAASRLRRMWILWPGCNALSDWRRALRPAEGAPQSRRTLLGLALPRRSAADPVCRSKKKSEPMPDTTESDIGSVPHPVGAREAQRSFKPVALPALRAALHKPGKEDALPTRVMASRLATPEELDRFGRLHSA